MTGTAADIANVMRQDRGRILSALVRGLKDFDLAEEALGDAVESALVHWARSGTPANPRAWLLRVARRKAIDRIRRQARFAARMKDIEMLAEADQEAATAERPDIPDERLALIFTCCHPALEPKSRVALTLRTLGGLTTAQIARAFLDAEATMGQRLSRAKAKIARAGIAYEVSGRELWHERLESVLTVIYLIYNQCYTTAEAIKPQGDDLCAEAIHLARMVAGMLPGETEVQGLLALLLLIDARRPARRNPQGETVPLAEQDAGLWNAERMAEGLALLDAIGPGAEQGAFAVQARITAEHMRNGPGGTPWPRVLSLYDLLYRLQPTPVVALNRAVAVAEVLGAEAALAALEPIADDLEGYQPFHAARANLLERLGRTAEARADYDRAIALAASEADAAWLRARRDRPRG